MSSNNVVCNPCLGPWLMPLFLIPALQPTPLRAKLTSIWFVLVPNGLATLQLSNNQLPWFSPYPMCAASAFACNSRSWPCLQNSHIRNHVSSNYLAIKSCIYPGGSPQFSLRPLQILVSPISYLHLEPRVAVPSSNSNQCHWYEVGITFGVRPIIPQSTFLFAANQLHLTFEREEGE